MEFFHFPYSSIVCGCKMFYGHMQTTVAKQFLSKAFWLETNLVLAKVVMVIFQRKICVIAGIRTTDLQFSVLAP